MVRRWCTGSHWHFDQSGHVIGRKPSTDASLEQKYLRKISTILAVNIGEQFLELSLRASQRDDNPFVWLIVMTHEPSESSEDDSEDKSSPKSAISVCGGGFVSICLFVVVSPLFESSDSSSLSDEVDEDELESWFESDSEKRPSLKRVKIVTWWKALPGIKI